MLILSLACLVGFYASERLSYRQTPTCRPRHTLYVTVVVFLCPSVRTTLAQTEIYVLTTQVRNLDKDDWKNMRRLIRYLKRTIKLPLILHADGVKVIKWWVDTSYAAQNDMRGHTGGTMSMGKNRRGAIISIPKTSDLHVHRIAPMR